MSELRFKDSHTALYKGDCRDMSELADNSVHCCVTSPPYFGKRVYKGDVELDWATWHGQLGLEPTIELYLEHLVGIFREVKRVLRKDGVLWLNMGDSMASGKGTCFNPGGGENSLGQNRKAAGAHPLDRGNKSTLTRSGLKPLDLCNIPHRVAEALQRDGWYWRSTVIWEKPNPMPESVNGWRWERHRVKVAPSARANPGSHHAEAQPDKPQGARDGREFASHDSEYTDCPGCPKCEPNDGLILRKGSWRPTSSYEYIFLLTKSNSYFCDQEAVREKSITEDPRRPYTSIGAWEMDGRPETQRHGGEKRNGDNFSGRNLRDVWQFPTQAYGGAHFATFPEKLPEICIKASTSERGVCPKCGAQCARVIKKSGGTIGKGSWVDHSLDDTEGKTRRTGSKQGSRENRNSYSIKALGWRATCKCNAGDPISATVLDPFVGTGTTLYVAKRLGRRGVGYDISEEYVQMAIARTKQGVLL